MKAFYKLLIEMIYEKTIYKLLLQHIFKCTIKNVFFFNYCKLPQKGFKNKGMYFSDCFMAI